MFFDTAYSLPQPFAVKGRESTKPGDSFGFCAEYKDYVGSIESHTHTHKSYLLRLVAFPVTLSPEQTAQLK